jgi:hypothetical protein
MENNQIINGNKIIAEFMGYTYFPFNMEGVKDPGWKTTKDTSHFTKNNKLFFLRDSVERDYLCRNHHQLCYHSDWNWLMEVCKKINETKLLLPMNGIEDSIMPWINAKRPVVKGLINMDIMETWSSVVEYIKWYKKNNK